jgi:hypothetical protein
LHESAGERDRSSGKIDLVPSERQELAATRAGAHRETEVGEQRGVGASNRLEEGGDTVGRRRADLGGFETGWRGCARRIGPDPLPADRLGERSVQHDMDSVHGPRREPAGVASANAQQVGVEVVDVRGGQLGDGQVAEMREQVVGDDRAGLADRRGSPMG